MVWLLSLGHLGELGEVRGRPVSTTLPSGVEDVRDLLDGEAFGLGEVEVDENREEDEEADVDKVAGTWSGLFRFLDESPPSIQAENLATQRLTTSMRWRPAR
jgi:hypothetical protein